MTKWTTEIDDPARIPDSSRAPSIPRPAGRPGPVVIALPEDMLTERVVVPDAPPFEPVETWPGLTDMSRLQKLLWAQRSRSRSLAAAAGRKRPAPPCSVSPSVFVAGDQFFRRGHLFDQTASVLRGRPRRRTQSESRRAHQGCRPAAADRRAPERNAEPGLFADRHSRPSRPSCMCIPARKNSAASIIRIWRSMPRRPPSPRRSKACRRRRRSLGGRHQHAHADYLAFSEKPTQVPGNVNVGEIMVWLRGQLQAGRHHLQRRRKFLGLDPSLLSLPQIRNACRPDLGLDGLRRARGGRDEAALSGAHGVLPRRRRRLPDERPGIRHRRAIRLAGDHRDRRQRHVRHHPHASGARISRPRGRDRAEKSGFRGLCARLWRLRRAGREDRDFAKAFQDANASGKPAIIHLKVDPEAITPSTTLHAIRDKALKEA